MLVVNSKQDDTNYLGDPESPLRHAGSYRVGNYINCKSFAEQADVRRRAMEHLLRKGKLYRRKKNGLRVVLPQLLGTSLCNFCMTSWVIRSLGHNGNAGSCDGPILVAK